MKAMTMGLKITKENDEVKGLIPYDEVLFEQELDFAVVLDWNRLTIIDGTDITIPFNKGCFDNDIRDMLTFDAITESGVGIPDNMSIELDVDFDKTELSLNIDLEDDLHFYCWLDVTIFPLPGRRLIDDWGQEVEEFTEYYDVVLTAKGKEKLLWGLSKELLDKLPIPGAA